MRNFLVTLFAAVLLVAAMMTIGGGAKMVPTKHRKNVAGPATPPAQGFCGDPKGPPSLRCTAVPEPLKKLP